jgi:hypothetical protein
MTRPPTSPQKAIEGTIRDEVDELQAAITRASELAARMAAGALKLQIDNTIGLLRSESSMKLDKAGKSWRAIAIGAIACSTIMGTAWGTFSKAYKSASSDVQAQQVDAAVDEDAKNADEAKKESKRDTDAATLLRLRLNASDLRHEKTEAKLETISSAISDNTKVLSNIAGKLDEISTRKP